MRRLVVLLAVALSGCSTTVRLRGRYAAALSADDIHQIQRIVQEHPHFGQTVIICDARRKDRVLVKATEYSSSGYSGGTVGVIRENGRWKQDPGVLPTGEAMQERVISVY
jgi:hypothetical protein